MTADLLLLATMLSVAAWTDLRRRRIPNTLVLAGLLSALAVAGYTEGWAGLKQAVFGALVGLTAFLPFFALRLLGAGDVKLMAAVGAFSGPVLVLVIVLFTMIAGGLLSVGSLLVHRRARETLENIKGTAASVFLDPRRSAQTIADLGQRSALRVPYAWAIGAGTLAGYLSRG